MNEKNLGKLERIARSVLPKVADKLIIDVDDGYLMYNLYTINRHAGGTYQVNTVNNSMESIVFNRIKNAVTWVVLYHRHQVYQARRVRELDILLASIEVSKSQHNRMKKSKDTDVYLIHTSKLSEDNARQLQFTAELDKYITSARISQIRGFENELKRTSRE